MSNDYAWSEVETSTLVYCTEWATGESTIRACVFGKMVELAKDVVTNYVSDLYHDAMWIALTLDGPCSFEYVVRDYGTHVGESATYIKIEEDATARKYRFDLFNDGGRWKLTISQASIVQEDPLDVSCTGYKGVYGIYHDEDGSVCPVHDNNGALRKEFDSDGTFTEDDRGNWSPVDVILQTVFPSVENKTQVQLVPDTTKGNTGMYDLINDLREKLDAANSAKDELTEAKYDIDNAIDDLETYVSDLDDLIGSLDNLPEISVSVSLDVDFES